jgi:hypothetical protein
MLLLTTGLRQAVKQVSLLPQAGLDGWDGRHPSHHPANATSSVATKHQTDLLYPNEVIMRFELDVIDTPNTLAAPLVRLWILRILVVLGKYKKLIDRHGQTTEEYDLLAHAIGITH